MSDNVINKKKSCEGFCNEHCQVETTKVNENTGFIEKTGKPFVCKCPTCNVNKVGSFNTIKFSSSEKKNNKDNKKHKKEKA